MSNHSVIWLALAAAHPKRINQNETLQFFISKLGSLPKSDPLWSALSCRNPLDPMNLLLMSSSIEYKVHRIDRPWLHQLLHHDCTSYVLPWIDLCIHFFRLYYYLSTSRLGMDAHIRNNEWRAQSPIIGNQSSPTEYTAHILQFDVHEGYLHVCF